MKVKILERLLFLCIETVADSYWYDTVSELGWSEEWDARTDTEKNEA
jgi:hypothetical protein